MKEICLEIIAHKALILCFNLTQCAQISYQGDEEKERDGDGSFSHSWGGETRHVSQRVFVSLGRKKPIFPYSGKRSKDQTFLVPYVSTIE